MAIIKTVTPYELLARWRDGKLSGAHVQFLTTVTEDGVKLSETVGDVMPVDVGQGIGFPLADILSQMHVAALAAVDAANTEKAVAEQNAIDLQDNLDAKMGELSATNAKLAAATAELTTLKAEPIRGVTAVLDAVQ